MKKKRRPRKVAVRTRPNRLPGILAEMSQRMAEITRRIMAADARLRIVEAAMRRERTTAPAGDLAAHAAIREALGSNVGSGMYRVKVERTMRDD